MTTDDQLDLLRKRLEAVEATMGEVSQDLNLGGDMAEGVITAIDAVDDDEIDVVGMLGYSDVKLVREVVRWVMINDVGATNTFVHEVVRRMVVDGTLQVRLEGRHEAGNDKFTVTTQLEVAGVGGHEQTVTVPKRGLDDKHLTEQVHRVLGRDLSVEVKHFDREKHDKRQVETRVGLRLKGKGPIASASTFYTVWGTNHTRAILRLVEKAVKDTFQRLIVGGGPAVQTAARASAVEQVERDNQVGDNP